MYLRNRFLNTTAFLLDTANEGKTPAQLAAEQRSQIKVEVGARSDAEGTTNEGNKDQENTEDQETDNENDNGQDDENNAGEDENKEKIENETNEQKTERIAKEKEDRRQSRIQKRIDKLTAENKTSKDEIAQLKAQLAEKPKEGLSEEEVERRATAKAQEKAAQIEADNHQKEFDKNIKKLAADGVKVDKDFSDKINELAEDIGPIPARMINILADLDNENGGAVLAHLANNVDEAEELWSLPIEKMTIKLVRLSDKLKPAPRSRQISRAPTPNKPIDENNNANSGNVLPANPTSNMDDYVRIRNAQAAEYRKRHFR